MAAIAPYVPVADMIAAPDGLTERETIEQCLFWIRFRIDTQRTSLIDDAYGSYGDIKMLTDKDINSMAEDWSRRVATGGQMYFGTNPSKYLKAFTHWVMDFFRAMDVPHVNGLTEAQFRNQLQRAIARSEVCANMKENASTAADTASPGPLESKRKWKTWEEKFVNYL